MTASGTETSIGFLSFVDGGDAGVLGGYLVLNAVGRPLEFHCTAPVKANRAQEILFGPTLQPFLYGEQIGQTLINKSKLKPAFVCVDHPAALSVRSFLSTAVILIEEAVEDAESPRAALRSFVVVGVHAAVDPQFAADAETVESHFAAGHSPLDLVEPFGRIREAIDEAKRGRRDSRAA